MKLIGHMTDGAMLLSATKEEMTAVMGALAAINGALTGGPEVLSAPAQKAAPKQTRTDKAGENVCNACRKSKPQSDYYTGNARCKPCFLAAQKARKLASGKHDAAPPEVRKSISRMLGEDDRPKAGGRVLPVGSGD